MDLGEVTSREKVNSIPNNPNQPLIASEEGIVTRTTFKDGVYTETREINDGFNRVVGYRTYTIENGLRMNRTPGIFSCF